LLYHLLEAAASDDLATEHGLPKVRAGMHDISADLDPRLLPDLVTGRLNL
jgi:hypothetical protein